LCTVYHQTGYCTHPPRHFYLLLNELFHDYNPAWLPHLHPFSEMAIVKKLMNIQAKLKNRGLTAIYLVLAADHTKNVYNFYNPKTRQCIQ
jgi:hypothetical protein